MIAWVLISATFWIGIPLAIFLFARRLLHALSWSVRQTLTASL